MKAKIGYEVPLLAAAAFAAVLVALGVGYKVSDNSKNLQYEGDIWCVSNFIEKEPTEYLADGRPVQDPLLNGKETWIRKDQVKVDSNSPDPKQDAIKKVVKSYFQPSNKDELKAKLTAADEKFFTSHFNEGAVDPGPCWGSGDEKDGRWINDVVREQCLGPSAGADTTGSTSSGNCAVKSETISLRNKGNVSLPATGKIVQEDHLVTKEENFSPSNTKDRISEHYQITQKAIGRTYDHTSGWTPAEGGGSVGSGSGSRPPAASEPWVMNMYWKSKPKEGTRVILKNPSNGKTVVAVAGYETGPSTSYLLGAQEETLKALGAKTGSSIQVGFAQDQNLPLGPIQCSSSSQTILENARQKVAKIISNVEVTADQLTNIKNVLCPADLPDAGGPTDGDDIQGVVADAANKELGESTGVAAGNISSDIAGEQAIVAIGKVEGLGSTALPGGPSQSPSYNTCHGSTLCHPDKVSGHNAINGYGSGNGDAIDISNNNHIAYAAFDGTVSRISGGDRADLVGALLKSTNGQVYAYYYHVVPSKSGSVKAGEPIGRFYPLNSPHIHFEMRVNGKMVHGNDRSGESAWQKSLWRNMATYLGLAG